MGAEWSESEWRREESVPTCLDKNAGSGRERRTKRPSPPSQTTTSLQLQTQRERKEGRVSKGERERERPLVQNDSTLRTEAAKEEGTARSMVARWL